jgi:tRNA 2-selenouridine synthase
MNDVPPDLPKIYLVGGLTGSGKTELLNHLSTAGEQVIDLEKLCSHDGSAFATLRFGPQPSAYAFNKQLNRIWRNFDKSKPVFIENELQQIGRIKVPDWLYRKMSCAPIIWLNTVREIRVQRLCNIIRCSDPVAFCNCISNLSPHVSTRNIEHIIQVFSKGDIVQTVELLLDYYDNAKGYVISYDRLILQLEITCSNMKSCREFLVDALT